MGIIYVKPGHIQPLWAGHPWVFAQAVERVEGGASPGQEVLVRDPRGNTLGVGLYSPGSALPVRLFSRDPQAKLDFRFLMSRLQAAVAKRKELGLVSADNTAVRWVHAEGDGLPGLVVDGFGDVLVYQLGTIGMKQREATIIRALTELLNPKAIVDRTSERIARAEHFEATPGIVSGDRNVDALDFLERGLHFHIPFELAQKTGFYLDQRPLRARVEQLAAGRRVLDIFCYVGAVGLSAARGGATVVDAVDNSALAIEVGAECARLNHLERVMRFEQADALTALNHSGRHGGYDLVVCDPPKLAPTRAARTRAVDYMRKLSAAGCRATRPGGLLVISSCSAALGLSELTRAIALGSRDTGTEARVLERWFQGPDHPVSAAFPEGLYLSSLLVEVTPIS